MSRNLLDPSSPLLEKGRVGARRGQAPEYGPLLDPYSSYPSRASRGTLVHPGPGVGEPPRPPYSGARVDH